jgi:hypothetical protein
MCLKIQSVFVNFHQTTAYVSHEKPAPSATSRDSCGAQISDERYSLYSVRFASVCNCLRIVFNDNIRC